MIYKEVASIQAACKKLEDGYRPGITFVVVQKRHHTRLFCSNRDDQVSRMETIDKQLCGIIPEGIVLNRLAGVVMYHQELL